MQCIRYAHRRASLTVGGFGLLKRSAPSLLLMLLPEKFLFKEQIVGPSLCVYGTNFFFLSVQPHSRDPFLDVYKTPQFSALSRVIFQVI